MLEQGTLRSRLHQASDAHAVVVFPMRANPVFALLAQVAIARNPWLNDPPPYSPLAPSDITGLKMTVGIADATHRALAAISVAPQYWRADALARMLSDTAAGKLPPSASLPVGGQLPTAEQLAAIPMAIISSARIAQMQMHIPRARTRLMSDERFAALLTKMAGMTDEETFTLEDIGKGLGAGGLADTGASEPSAIHAAFTALSSSGRVLNSGYFKGSEKKTSEDREDKELRDSAARATRLATFVEYCATRYFDFALRPYLHFILEPTVMARLNYYVNPETLAIFVERARAILSRPTTPWIAEALRFFAPSQRSTVLGRSPSTGMWAHLLGKKPSWNVNDMGALSIEAENIAALDIRRIYEVLRPVVDSYHERIRLWEQIGDLPGLESAMRCVQVGPPVQSWLWGPDMPIIHASPIALSAQPANYGELLTGLTLPSAVDTQRAGSFPFRYTSTDERDIKLVGGVASATRSELRQHASLSIEPEDRTHYIGADMAGVIPPTHVRFARVPDYNGEPDAVIINASMEDLAFFFNKSLLEFQQSVLDRPSEWEHLIEVSGPPDAPLFRIKSAENNGVTVLVYSSLTRREPWQRLVTLPSLSPSYGTVVSRGFATINAPVVMRLLMDPEPVSVPLPAQGVVDTLIRVAISPMVDALWSTPISTPLRSASSVPPSPLWTGPSSSILLTLRASTASDRPGRL